MKTTMSKMQFSFYMQIPRQSEKKKGYMCIELKLNTPNPKKAAKLHSINKLKNYIKEII